MAADRVTDAMVDAACSAYNAEDISNERAWEGAMRAALTAALRAEAGAVGFEDALRQIAAMCPATCEMTNEHTMAQIAIDALAQARRNDRA